MKTLTEGHKYQLRNFENNENPQTPRQIIQFIEKAPINDGAGGVTTLNDGTTNEEVLEMLINRMKFLQNKFPCRENAIVITNLEESLMWLNKRTSDRIKRDVEGKHLV